MKNKTLTLKPIKHIKLHTITRAFQIRMKAQSIHQETKGQLGFALTNHQKFAILRKSIKTRIPSLRYLYFNMAQRKSFNFVVKILGSPRFSIN